MAGVEIVRLPPDVAATEDDRRAIDAETACVVVQTPGFLRQLRDLRADRRGRATRRARC